MARTWKCQRSTGGVRCGHSNPGRKQKCEACGEKRGPLKRPRHMAALDVPYEEYVFLNGGEHCGICGRPPKDGKRLQRDHDHRGDGHPRGLLCFACNRWLRGFMTVEWLRKAIAYLERAESWR